MQRDAPAPDPAKVAGVIAGLTMLLLAGCSSTHQAPAPDEYWRSLMCVQPKYANLERCTEEREQLQKDQPDVE